jgi:hypothetical protein
MSEKYGKREQLRRAGILVTLIIALRLGVVVAMTHLRCHFVTALSS